MALCGGVEAAQKAEETLLVAPEASEKARHNPQEGLHSAGKVRSRGGRDSRWPRLEY